MKEHLLFHLKRACWPSPHWARYQALGSLLLLSLYLKICLIIILLVLVGIDFLMRSLA